MQDARFRKINVVAKFAAFREGRGTRRIMPSSFTTEQAEVYQVERVRRVYQDRVGDSLHIHFVVKTTCDRYFDIVYDSKKLQWAIAVEIEDTLLFSE